MTTLDKSCNFFFTGTNIHEQSRSDFCRLRFKSKGYSKLKAKNQHMSSAGIDVYYSGEKFLISPDHRLITVNVFIW